jgi:predicted RNA-binding Zn-ribbon protein involved in translation (DUF1610 family)
MGRSKVPMFEKKSRLLPKIEDYFRERRHEEISFAGILAKYFHLGQSGEFISSELQEMTNDEIKIPVSTLVLGIKLLHEQGKTDFHLKAGIKNNPYRKPGSGRKIKNKSVVKIGESITGQKIVTFSCSECGSEYEAYLEHDKDEMFGLMSYRCEKCGAIGSGSIEYDGKKKSASGSFIEGIDEEIFA